MTGDVLLRKVYRFTASLKLTLIILSTLAVILIAATWLSGYDITVGSLRRDLYGSWWFNILLVALMANLVACTVIRKPWRFWQWGFLVTHSGVLTLLIGAGISFNWKIYGHMTIPEGGTADSFEVEGERELVLASGNEERRERLAINPYVRSKPNVPVRLPAGLGSIRIAEYVPNVAFEDAYGPDPNGRFDVIEVKIHLEGRLQETFWLRRNEARPFNRLTFAYAGPEEAMFRQMSAPPVEKPTLVLTIDGDTRSIDVQESVGKPVAVGKRTVTIRELFRSLTIGEGNKPQENPMAPDANPAVLFDVEKDGKAESFYSYAFFPDQGPIRKGSGMHQDAAPDFSAEYRLAGKSSRFWIFAFPEGLRYALTTERGSGLSGPLAPGQRVKHPTMPMDLQVEVAQRIPKAEPTVREQEVRKGVPPMPAIRVTGTGKAAGHSTWLKMHGEQMRLTLPEGFVDLRFAPLVYSGLGMSVHLLRFKNPPHPGTGSASKFESDLRVTESDSGLTIDGTTGVNYPFSHAGWSFYQSSFNDQFTPVTSTLQVSFDPGKPVLYLGFIMVVSGTLFMLFLKPMLLRLVKAAKGVRSPLGAPATIAALVGLSAGTLTGMAALVALPAVSALLVGSLVAAVGIGLAFAAAGGAIAWSARRPGSALEVARIVSLTWCLNTASLVLLMWSRVA